MSDETSLTTLANWLQHQETFSPASVVAFAVAQPGDNRLFAAVGIFSPLVHTSRGVLAHLRASGEASNSPAVSLCKRTCLRLHRLEM